MIGLGRIEGYAFRLMQFRAPQPSSLGACTEGFAELARVLKACGSTSERNSDVTRTSIGCETKV